MMYESSKGAVEISTMGLSHAKNALNKLRRNEPERVAEIEALDTHVSRLELAATEEALTPPVRDGAAPIGDNNPPVDEPELVITGRDAIDAHVLDLLDQVRGCCLVIENEDQANVVGRLHRDLQKAVKLVDGSADDEKAPLNKAIAEIATWQNAYTAAKLKKTPDGSLTKALLATTNLTSTWLRKLDEERKQREAALAKEAADKAREALAAREEAKVSTDVEVMDRAQDSLAEAQALIKQAVGVSKERVRAGGGGDGYRAMTLRSIWSAVFTDDERSGNLALAHYMRNPEFVDELKALILQWANRDAKTEAGRAHPIPGIHFHEEKAAA